MRYVDVIFPLNLGPLTYKVPAPLEGRVAPGTIVKAELKNSIKGGVVLGPSIDPPRGRLKELAEADAGGAALSPAMLRLIGWMSGYYFAREGAVLKSVLPPEFFRRVRPRGGERNLSLEAGGHTAACTLDEAALGGINEVREHAFRRAYRAFLLHAPSTGHEISGLLEAIRGLRNVIILVPDRAGISRVAGAVGEVVGKERLALYHAGLSRGGRSEAIERMASGRADVVIGSRGAVFAPLREVSLIAVLQEESTAYKEEGGIRYNARDMAVMRGFMEGAAVLLSSICPSVESFHNAQSGKYGLIGPRPTRLRPRVRVVNMRGAGSSVSGVLRQAAERALGTGGKVMLYINRKGFSMLECADCGRLEVCPRCDIPMVFYKSRRLIRCGYCGRESAPPDLCPACRGHGLRPVGTGMERVEEETRLLNPVAVDKKTKGLIEVIAEAEGGLALGTKVLTRSALLSGGFSVAGVVNADSYLHIPDFRSAERAYQDFMYLADRLKPGGQLIIQTRNPGAPLFGYLRNFNARRFYREELGQRRELGYPPYSKMAIISVEGDAEPRLDKAEYGEVEVLGPVQGLDRRGKRPWRLLLKAPDSGRLRPVVEGILKGLKGRRAVVDLDPVGV